MARLELIGRLQARGYSLAGIGDLLRSWRDGGDLGKPSSSPPPPRGADHATVSAARAVCDEAPAIRAPFDLPRIVPTSA